MSLENKTCTIKPRDMNITSTVVMLKRVLGEILASNNSRCTRSKNCEKNMECLLGLHLKKMDTSYFIARKKCLETTIEKKTSSFKHAA